MPPLRSLICANLFFALLQLIGCEQNPAGSGEAPSNPTQAVSITTQPASQIVPIGRAGTFTVVATGTAPLSYQWSENGTPIEGATGASYTTPTVVLSDSGSTFQVTVTNAAGSLTSSAAKLTAGPRAPAIGDLRYLLFQEVTVPGWVPGALGPNGQITALHTGINDGASASYPNAIGSPLLLGSTELCYPGVEYDCAWFFSIDDLPSGMAGLNTLYSSGAYTNLSSDLQSIAAPNVVIDCLDLEPAENAYAFSAVQTTQTGGFDYRFESVPASQLASTVAADGAESRVITAVSIDTTSGNVDLISYGWTGDTTTVYDTQAVIAGAGGATPAAISQDVGSAASTLASQGYVISAFGGDDTNGYVLVGMRVQGDTMPRPAAINVTVNAVDNFTPASNPDTALFTSVVYLEEYGGGAGVAEQ